MILTGTFELISIVWLVLVIATIVIELVTEEMDCIWFAAGALVALLLSLIGVKSIIIQVVVFTVVSCLLLLTVGRWAKKKLECKTTPTNIDAAIGKEVIVIKNADSLNYGEGKYNGLIWTITCAPNESVETGDIAIVVEVNGNKLVVSKK